MSHGYVICNDCKTVMATKIATPVRVHEDAENGAKVPVIRAYVCPLCLYSGRYDLPKIDEAET